MPITNTVNQDSFHNSLSLNWLSMTLNVLNDVNQLTIGRIMELIELTSTMLFLFSLCDLTCVCVLTSLVLLNLSHFLNPPTFPQLLIRNLFMTQLFAFSTQTNTVFWILHFVCMYSYRYACGRVHASLVTWRG